MVNKCCVQGCNTKGYYGIVMRSFPPIESPLFEQWKLATNNVSLKNMDNLTIRKRKKVCNLHFPVNYRKRTHFFSYDFPMLMENNKVENKVANLDNSHSNKTVAEEINVKDINRISSNNLTPNKNVNQLDHLYCKMQTENVQEVNEGVVVNSMSTTVNVKSLDTEDVLQNIRRKKQKQMIIQNIQRRKRMQNRIYYLEKLNKKYKAECKEFANFKKLNRNVQNFVKSQLCNAGKKSKGEYYTLEDKVLALNIFKQSRTCYKYLSNIFKLPSLSTVMKFNGQIKTDPALNDNIIDILRQHIHKTSSMEEKLVTLIFDEISVNPHYDCLPRRGMLSGLEDKDGNEEIDKIVDHAQVFMMRSVYKDWAFPVSYMFNHGSTKSATIVRYIQELVTKITEMGYVVIALVCDQSPTNCAAIEMLLENSQRIYVQENKKPQENIIRIGKYEIVPIYDICNLIKCLRNNLLKQNLKFMLDGDIFTASWEDIKAAYFIDASRKIRSLQKITAEHVIAEKIPKIEVSKALQVFSQTVSAMMQIMIEANMSCPNGKQLTSDSMGTALLCNFVNKLFDSLNLGIINNKDNKIKEYVTADSTHLKLWYEANEVFKRMLFVNLRNETIEQPPLMHNFVTTINGFIKLHSILLKKRNLKYLPTNSFNQNPLENIFGELRHMQGLNKPACDLLKNQTTLNNSIDDNCETDLSATSTSTYFSTFTI